MKKKIYKLSKGCEKFSASPEDLGPLRSLELRLNKRRVQKVLKARGFRAKSRRQACLLRWFWSLGVPLLLWLTMVGFCVLFSKLGI